MAKEQTRVEVNFKKLTEYILNSYLNSNSEENMEVLKLLDESMSVIGTGKQEFFRNLQEFSRAFVFEVEQRERIQFSWSDFRMEEQKIDEAHMLVYGSVMILGTFPDGNVNIRMDSRFTILYGFLDGIWKVLHIHHSVPDKDQMQNEEFPRTLGQQIEESQSMIAALTADYLNVYVVEPEKNQGSVLKLDGYVVAGIHEESKNFSYSEMLRRYANARVCDEDRDEFLRIFLPETLIKSFADGRERLELNYRVPIGGRLEHYSGLYIRISKQTEPLKLIAGFRNTEDIISLQSKTRKEGMYSAYEAVSDLYLAMFRINIKENKYASIKTTEEVLKYTIPNSNRYDENLTAIISALADEESLAAALEFLKLDTMEERLRGKKHIFLSFNGRVVGLCRLHLIREGSDTEGSLSHVILAVEVLDEVAKSYEKLDAMHEIITASKMGTWSIYLLEGQHPRLEADALMQELLGIADKTMTPEEAYDTWFANITPGSLESVLQSVEKMKSEGRDENTYLWKHPVLGERYVRCGGTAKPIEGGFVLRGYHYDVDEAVREQKEKDKALAEQIAIIDTLAGNFKNVFVANLNSGTARVVRLAEDYDVRAVMDVVEKDFSFDSVIKQWIQENVYPDDKKKMTEAFAFENLCRVFSEQNEFSGTYRSTEGGKLHHYQFDFRKADESGNIVAGFQVIDAIVEEHEQQAKRDLEYQEALANALASAQQANKAKTTFLNSMSHDIRTPMNAIVGFTALAQTHSDNQAQVQDYLGKISTSSTHLLSLINDILDMSRIESGTVKLQETEVHIPDLLHELRTMIQSLIKAKNQNLFMDTQDVIHEDVLADKLRLNQVLLNIVGNAIKFTQSGGDIMIRLIEKPCNMKDYTTYEFSVKDNGIGMSKEFVGHIFDAFSREYTSTVSGIQGTGLGMAITKNIVDMMGGDIRVESEEGKGSLFTVTLNLRIGDKFVKTESIPELLGANALVVDDMENLKKEKQETCDFGGKRVLLVEDNELNREIATAILEEAGMTVDIAEDGDIAVAAIDKSPSDRYDLIFMDIQMPKMDGYTATREIRTLPDNRKANIPIIAMTANAFEEDKRKSYASGMNGHIIKPISIEEIVKVLDEIFVEKDGAI